MQCEQLQRRLDDLLDRREDVHSDPEVGAHAATCAACRRLVRAYESMLLGIDLIGEAELEDQFVRRTVDSADRRRRRAKLGRRILSLAAVAAMVLVAVFPARWALQGTLGDGSTTIAENQSPQDAATNPRTLADLSPEAVARLCEATGRNLAILPQTVRRVAAHPKTDQIVGPMRPLAEPFGATWEVLLRAWPTDATPVTVIPEADTGYVPWRQVQHA